MSSVPLRIENLYLTLDEQGGSPTYREQHRTSWRKLEYTLGHKSFQETLHFIDSDVLRNLEWTIMTLYDYIDGFFRPRDDYIIPRWKDHPRERLKVVVEGGSRNLEKSILDLSDLEW